MFIFSVGYILYCCSWSTADSFCRQRRGHNDLGWEQRFSKDTTRLVRCRRHPPGGPQNGGVLVLPDIYFQLSVRSAVGSSGAGSHVIYSGPEHHHPQSNPKGANSKVIRCPTKLGWRRDRIQRHVGGRSEQRGTLASGLYALLTAVLGHSIE